MQSLTKILNQLGYQKKPTKSVAKDKTRPKYTSGGFRARTRRIKLKGAPKRRTASGNY